MTPISRLMAAALAGILGTVVPAQAQSVTFADVRDAMPLKFFSAATTAADPANPNALVIGFESGRSGVTDNDFSASTRDFGNRIATDTLLFNVVAPPGYYIAGVTFEQQGTTSITGTGDARGTSAWVVNGEPSVIGTFRTNPSITGSMQLGGTRPTVVQISLTTTLAAFATTTGGSATMSLTAAKVTATLAPLETGPVKKTATIQVTGFTGPYDGAEHRATGTATGVDGEDLSALLNLGAGFTNAPGGTANWTFAGNDGYNAASGSVEIDITPINAAINVTGFSGTYDGNPHGASGTATGAGNEILNGFLNLGDSFTNVPGGTAHWTFSGNPNYNAAQGDAEITINKATPTITWPAPASVVAGTALSATQLNATASVPGTFVYSPPAGTILTASQQLSVTFTPNDAVNYNGATATVSITVTANTGVQIVNPGPQTDRVGEDARLRLRVTAPSGSSRRGVFSAAGLPPGLALDDNEIRGEPTTVGTYLVTLTFAPAAGGSTTTQFEWTIVPGRRGGN